MHNCSGSKTRITFAATTTEDGGAVSEAVWQPGITFMLFTILADEASLESFGVEVSNAGLLIWKVLLEVWQTLGYNVVITIFRHR